MRARCTRPPAPTAVRTTPRTSVSPIYWSAGGSTPPPCAAPRVAHPRWRLPRWPRRLTSPDSSRKYATAPNDSTSRPCPPDLSGDPHGSRLEDRPCVNLYAFRIRDSGSRVVDVRVPKNEHIEFGHITDQEGHRCVCSVKSSPIVGPVPSEDDLNPVVTQTAFRRMVRRQIDVERSRCR